MTPSGPVVLITSVVESLAWPIFTTVIIIILRHHLREVINLAETVRFRGVELKFRDNMKDVAQRAELLRTSWDAITLKPFPKPSDLDPGIAVRKAWASVETAIENLTITHQHEPGREVPKTTPRRIDRLEQANIIDQPLAGTLRDMNAARDMIAHGEDIALHYETVKLFEDTAAYVESVVEQLEESRPPSR